MAETSRTASRRRSAAKTLTLAFGVLDRVLFLLALLSLRVLRLLVLRLAGSSLLLILARVAKKLS